GDASGVALRARGGGARLHARAAARARPGAALRAARRHAARAGRGRARDHLRRPLPSRRGGALRIAVSAGAALAWLEDVLARAASPGDPLPAPDAAALAVLEAEARGRAEAPWPAGLV